jgi:exopolyphosphatase/guanosine-5'-triphosphate,3'-diphosphate pyrophosphatase
MENADDRRRLAAIDVGTNSLRLVVAEASPDRTYRVIDDEKVVTRLGRGLARTRMLDPKAMEETALAIAHLKQIAEGFSVDALRIAGTCAVREAENRQEFMQLVAQRAGDAIEIVSSEEEARLAFLSVNRAFDLESLVVGVVDIGGGSTEIVLSSGTLIDQIYAIPLGAVRLREQFVSGETITADEFHRMRRYARQVARDVVGRPPMSPQLVIGTGGTFTTLGAVSLYKATAETEGDEVPFTIRGYEMHRSEVRHILDSLRKQTIVERQAVPGLSPERADIIVAGLTIVDTVLKTLRTNRLRIHDQGIRDGMILDLMERVFPPTEHVRSARLDRMSAVRRFAESCQCDPVHANHVAVLALQIFDGLATALPKDSEHWATPQNRDLLEAAAVLHDAGYLVNYSRHHKHSYHLIVHSDLPGFTRQELDIIASIARYHRGARPKEKHKAFGRMGPDDRDLVRRMAAMLRVAAGLDRAHSQKLHVVRIEGTKRTIRIVVASEHDPAVELWGAERASRLLESVFDRQVSFVRGADEVSPDDGTNSKTTTVKSSKLTSN